VSCTFSFPSVYVCREFVLCLLCVLVCAILDAVCMACVCTALFPFRLYVCRVFVLYPVCFLYVLIRVPFREPHVSVLHAAADIARCLHG
jgi:hypothetical protein